MYYGKPRVGVFFVYFDYNESRMNDVWYMCKLMNELFTIENDFVLKKVLNLQTLGVSYSPKIHGVYSNGVSYTLEYADLMDCMHFIPKIASIE